MKPCRDGDSIIFTDTGINYDNKFIKYTDVQKITFEYEGYRGEFPYYFRAALIMVEGCYNSIFIHLNDGSVEHVRFFSRTLQDLAKIRRFQQQMSTKCLEINVIHDPYVNYHKASRLLWRNRK